MKIIAQAAHSYLFEAAGASYWGTQVRSGQVGVLPATYLNAPVEAVAIADRQDRAHVHVGAVHGGPGLAVCRVAFVADHVTGGGRFQLDSLAF